MKNDVFGKDAEGYKTTAKGSQIKTMSINASNVTSILADVDESKFITGNSMLPEGFETGYYVASLPIDNGNLRSTHIIAQSENEILLLGVELEHEGEIYYPSAKPSSKAHLVDLVKQATKKADLQVIMKVSTYSDKESGELRFSSDIIKPSTWLRLSKKVELMNADNLVKNNMAKDFVPKAKVSKAKGQQKTTV